jgi:hypothetical protein
MVVVIHKDTVGLLKETRADAGILSSCRSLCFFFKFIYERMHDCAYFLPDSRISRSFFFVHMTFI